jgi:glycosyltransferase involved in cell wall biosynthesis
VAAEVLAVSAPEVSVVIPTRNRFELLLGSALRAALAQEGVEHEVIVVDDGSTDGTPGRIRALEHPRLRLVELGTRRGVAAARNAGIAAANGIWIAFLDDDDVWSPRKLRVQLDSAAEAEADFVYARVVSIDDRGNVRYAFPLPDPGTIDRLLLGSSVLPAGCSNVLARAALVRAVGCFDEHLFQLADWDLWIRLAHAGAAGASDEILVGYLEHDDNMLLSDPRDVTEELRYLDEKHRDLRAAHGMALDRATFSHWVAWGHLRRGRRLGAARVFLASGLANRRPHDVALAAAFAIRAAVPTGVARRLMGRRGLAGRATGPVDVPDWLSFYGTSR